jgi:hypothetical protein
VPSTIAPHTTAFFMLNPVRTPDVIRPRTTCGK